MCVCVCGGGGGSREGPLSFGLTYNGVVTMLMAAAVHSPVASSCDRRADGAVCRGMQAACVCARDACCTLAA